MLYYKHIIIEVIQLLGENVAHEFCFKITDHSSFFQPTYTLMNVIDLLYRWYNIFTYMEEFLNYLKKKYHGKY